MPTRRLTNVIPGFLKPVLRPLYHVFALRLLCLYKKITYRLGTFNKIHWYWREPWNFDNSNLPENYLKAKERSLFLVKIIKKYADFNTKILEIGATLVGI